MTDGRLRELCDPAKAGPEVVEMAVELLSRRPQPQAIRFPGNVVTLDDTRCPRPASPHGAGVPTKCFYCSGLTGKPHDESCVCIDRPVKLRMTVDIIVAVPRSWDQGQIEFKYGDSSWCADNIMAELERYSEAKEDCLCSHAKFEYSGEATLEEAIAHHLVSDTGEEAHKV